MGPSDADPLGARAGHAPVLAAGTLRLLRPQPGEVVVDCTAGRGGHAVLLARAVGPDGLVIGFDLDAGDLAFAAQRVRAAGGRFEPVHDSFVRAAGHLSERGLRADAVLADLGFSSRQMDDARRGFSFAVEGPLDMRYDPTGGATAADLLARLGERQLADLIHRCGEEPYARRIARAIVAARREAPLRTTARLADVVRRAYGARARRSRLNPATRTFMALRIAVNEELDALRGLLAEIERAAATPGWLAPGARVAVISFHSLEDRLVKRSFAELAARGLAERLTRRPLTPSEAEVADNPRARSAKLRAIRLTAGDAAAAGEPAA